MQKNFIGIRIWLDYSAIEDWSTGSKHNLTTGLSYVPKAVRI